MIKTNVNQGPVKDIKDKGKDIKDKGTKAAKQAAYSPAMERFMRLGYAVKGFIYIAMGYIAFLGVIGKSNSPADQLGAIGEFSKLPYAEVFLWVILVGLIAYALWGVIRAVLDPFHKGTDLKGLATRVGYLVSAATYASFVIPTYQLIQGARRGTGANQTAQMAARVMNMPMGRFLVGAVGLIAVGAGLYQVYSGIKMDFDQQFKPYALSPEQFRLAKQLGRFGTIARGIVFAIVGYFFCLAAYFANPSRAQGINGALKFLAGQPYGLWLLGIVAAGLIAFGVYSLLTAAWFRLKR